MIFGIVIFLNFLTPALSDDDEDVYIDEYLEEYYNADKYDPDKYVFPPYAYHYHFCVNRCVNGWVDLHKAPHILIIDGERNCFHECLKEGHEYPAEYE
ncbi:UNVERIFIED_CONTAM: hypothetical protein RMT77_014510 [Armadillidium vulgare]